MTETVAIALITAFTGISSAAIGSFLAARTADATRKNDYRKFLFEKRIFAYQSFLSAYSEYVKFPSSEDLYANLLISLQRVYLVASNKTYQYSSDFSSLVAEISPDKRASQDFRNLYHNLLQSLRRDLLDYKGN